jgi:hypothetical protein
MVRGLNESITLPVLASYEVKKLQGLDSVAVLPAPNR